MATPDTAARGIPTASPLEILEPPNAPGRSRSSKPRRSLLCRQCRILQPSATFMNSNASSSALLKPPRNSSAGSGKAAHLPNGVQSHVTNVIVRTLPIGPVKPGMLLLPKPPAPKAETAALSKASIARTLAVLPTTAEAAPSGPTLVWLLIRAPHISLLSRFPIATSHSEPALLAVCHRPPASPSTHVWCQCPSVRVLEWVGAGHMCTPRARAHSHTRLWVAPDAQHPGAGEAGAPPRRRGATD